MSFKYMPFKMIALLGALAFAVTLAIIVGERLSTEAMAVLMGVVAGVAASIPTSLIVVWIAMQSLMRQMPAGPAPRAESQSPADSPRIVVVQQPAPVSTYQPASWTAPYAVAGAYPAMPAPRSPRKFTVIGGAGEAEEAAVLEPLESDL
jgi:hypothetical protein